MIYMLYVPFGYHTRCRSTEESDPKITSRPHPYNSRQNDQVRSYLLQRLNDVARDHDFIHVLDDQTTSVHVDGLQAVYFQGNNVIVKVDGYEDYADGEGKSRVSLFRIYSIFLRIRQCYTLLGTLRLCGHFARRYG